MNNKGHDECKMNHDIPGEDFIRYIAKIKNLTMDEMLKMIEDFRERDICPYAALDLILSIYINISISMINLMEFITKQDRHLIFGNLIGTLSKYISVEISEMSPDEIKKMINKKDMH